MFQKAVFKLITGQISPEFVFEKRTQVIRKYEFPHVFYFNCWYIYH